MGLLSGRRKDWLSRGFPIVASVFVSAVFAVRTLKSCLSRPSTCDCQDFWPLVKSPGRFVKSQRARRQEYRVASAALLGARATLSDALIRSGWPCQ